MKRAFQILLQTVRKFTADNGTLLGAGISFYALFSAAPLLIFGIGLVSIILGDEAAEGLLVGQIEAYVGYDVARLIEQAVAASSQGEGGIFASIVGGLVILWGSHAIFVQLRRALNVVQGTPEDREHNGAIKLFAIERGLSIAALFLIGAALFAVAIITVVGRVFVSHFGNAIPVWRYLATPIDFVVTFVMVTFSVAVFYRVLPAEHPDWRTVLPGSVLVGVSFFAVKFALGLYLSYATIGSAYGAAGSLVAFMMWVFLSALIFLFGAEFNQVLAGPKENGRAS